MTDSRTGRLAVWANTLHRRLERRLRRSSDGGFLLLESVIAISLIAVIMAALGILFLNTVASADQGRIRSGAIQIADTTLENVRSQDDGSLTGGHDPSSVATEWATAQATSTPVSSWLSEMDPATDVAGSSTATIPTSAQTQTQGSTSYAVTQYLGWCYIPDSGSSTNCVKSAEVPTGTSSVGYLRVVVAVAWSGTHCTLATCVYVTSTLISTQEDPIFPNETLPSAPLVNNPGNQVNAVNDNVSLQLTAQNGTGVPPFTWNATGLPTNLAISPAGLISGVPTAQTATPASVTVTITDDYGRSASATFTWTIEPALIVSAVSPQASLTTSTVSLTLSASGGDGAPYAWSDPTSSLPPGLSISSAGKITGTPTRAGTYPVSVTVTDKGGVRTATGTFTWTVTYPPLSASNPGAQTNTVSTTISPLQLSASGGDGTYVWTATGLPAGLSMSSSGKITGAATATGSSTVLVTATDPTAGSSFTQTVTFTWTIVKAPTITSPGSLSTTEGANPSVEVDYTCPDGPCTIALTGAVPGVGLSSTTNRTGNNGTVSLSVSGSGAAFITGTVQGTAVTSGTSKAYTPSVTITSADGASPAAQTGAWTVYTTPTIATLVSTKVTETSNSNTAIAYTCPDLSCTITLGGSVPGLGLSTTSGPTGNITTTSLNVTSASGTVYIGGTVQNTAVTTGTSKAYTPDLTITDAAGVSPTATSATWTAYVLPTITGLATSTTTETATKNVALAYTCPYTNCTITLSGSVPGLDLSATTGKTGNNTTTSLTVSSASGTVYIGGTTQGTAVTTGTSKAYSLVLSISDGGGTSPADSTATWTAYTVPTIAGLANLSKAHGSAITNQTLTYTCPVASCTIAMTGQPSALGLDTDTSGTPSSSLNVTTASGSVLARGTISSTATKQAYSVVVTITDSDGAVATISATWTVT